MIVPELGQLSHREGLQALNLSTMGIFQTSCMMSTVNILKQAKIKQPKAIT